MPNIEIFEVPLENSSGHSVFPERFPTPTIQSMREAMGSYVYSTQMLMKPVATQDQIFKPVWLKYYTELPEELVLFGCVDPSSSRKKGSDYTVAMIIGLDAKKNWYIVDIVRDKLSPTERVDMVFNLYEKWNKRSQRPVYFIYEINGFQEVDRVNILNRMGEKGVYFQVKECENYAKRKGDRISSLQPLYEAGKVYWPKRLMYWSRYHKRDINVIEELRYEYEMFTPDLTGLKHDDMMDCHAMPMQMDDIQHIKAEPKKTVKELPEFCLINLRKRKKESERALAGVMGW